MPSTVKVALISAMKGLLLLNLFALIELKKLLALNLSLKIKSKL
jgi:hypothetical protein